MVGNQLKNQLQAAGISGIRNSCSSLTVLRDQDGEKTEERAFDGQLVSGKLQTVGFFGLILNRRKQSGSRDCQDEDNPEEAVCRFEEAEDTAPRTGRWNRLRVPDQR